MNCSKQKSSSLTAAILSLSLLTVMAGAAVAPALNSISEYFSDVNQLYVQMIISIPALFIVIGNLLFPKLAAKIKSRTLLMAGLALYVAGGCAAGLFRNIYLLLIFRAFVGLGVGIIMPMSTGLLAFYYTKDQQDKLMGYSSAMNQMGGVVATLLAGFLAQISWRVSFLVYLMGLISIVLCLLYLPNENIAVKKTESSETRQGGTLAAFYPYIIGMFLLMSAFFLYPSNYAIEIAKEGIIPDSLIAVIMAGADLVAFADGLSFVYIKKGMGGATKIIAPVLFLLGYICLALLGGWSGSLLGSSLIGFANGLGIPFLISEASKKAGKNAGTTVMPLISAALYIAQFSSPFIQGAVESLVQPFSLGAIFSALLFVWSILFIRQR